MIVKSDCDTKGYIQRSKLTKPVCLTYFTRASSKINGGMHVVKTITLATEYGYRALSYIVSPKLPRYLFMMHTGLVSFGRWMYPFVTDRSKVIHLILLQLTLRGINRRIPAIIVQQTLAFESRECRAGLSSLPYGFNQKDHQFILRTGL